MSTFHLRGEERASRLAFLTWSRHRSEIAASFGVKPGFSASCSSLKRASSRVCSHSSHSLGSGCRGRGGMNPVRVSTSKSCAARVEVSGVPATAWPWSGRGRARKWLRGILPGSGWTTSMTRRGAGGGWAGREGLSTIPFRTAGLEEVGVWTEHGRPPN